MVLAETPLAGAKVKIKARVKERFKREQAGHETGMKARTDKEKVTGRKSGGKRGYQHICVSGAEGPILGRKGYHDDDNQAGAARRTAGWGFEPEEAGLFRQLKKTLMERALGAELVTWATRRAMRPAAAAGTAGIRGRPVLR
jgi:hypothetical protein